MLTQKEVIRLFTYNDGILYWNVDSGARKVKGSPCGWLNSNGRLQTQVKGKAYLNHRIIFLLHNGYMPKIVDHVDGDFTNNRVENLREATHSQNMCNRKLNANSSSGVKNVCKSGSKWKVQIYLNGVHVVNKRFDDLELAELVALEARDKFHESFANHGVTQCART